MNRNSFFLSILGSTILLSATPVLACDSCGCALARVCENVKGAEENRPWFFDLAVEQQNWKKISSEHANELINEGHDFHDKTHEEFYHFMLGVDPVDRFTVLAEIPYVVREATEVENSDNLGKEQHSEGWGDTSLIGIYKVFAKDQDFIGVMGGVKFPTGETKNTNFQGDLFEVELQPGSGSYDYPIGIVYRHEIKPVVLSGNIAYVIKTKGAQNFQYGDLLFATLNADYTLNSASATAQTKIGLYTTIHHAQKDTSDGVRQDDSGETSLFLGPGLTVLVNDHLSISGNIQFPAYQTTGGVHQKLDHVWTAAAKLSW